jgi:hypothetical protein
MADSDPDENCAFTAARAIKQLQRAARSLDDRRFRDFAILAGGQTHIARRHDR